MIGLPGDRIRLRGGHVFVDGQALREPYAVYRPSAPDSFRDNFPRLQNADPDIDSRWWIRMRHLVDHGELLVPADSYFVLGDNRNDSEDSRYWGLVPRAAIEGTPLLIYFSLQQDDGAGDAGLPGGNNSSSGVPSGSLSALAQLCSLGPDIAAGALTLPPPPKVRKVFKKETLGPYLGIREEDGPMWQVAWAGWDCQAARSC